MKVPCLAKLATNSRTSSTPSLSESAHARMELAQKTVKPKRYRPDLQGRHGAVASSAKQQITGGDEVGGRDLIGCKPPFHLLDCLFPCWTVEHFAAFRLCPHLHFSAKMYPRTLTQSSSLRRGSCEHRRRRKRSAWRRLSAPDQSTPIPEPQMQAASLSRGSGKVWNSVNPLVGARWHGRIAAPADGGRQRGALWECR